MSLPTNTGLSTALPSAPGVARSPSVAEALVRSLEELGVQLSFGLIGGAISPFCKALAESSIAYLHFRHETGAAFAALEASLASGRPTVVFTTAGPGLTNALTGMAAARWDGAHVILVSASTSPPHRGRAATQETGAVTLPTDLFLTGPPFHYATVLDHPAQVAAVATELARGIRRPNGYVAHISLPISIQTEAVSGWAPMPDRTYATATCSNEVVRDCAQRLASGRFAIWIGFGARGAAESVRALAERTRAPVFASPRAKGVFPEDHPLYLGVTGLGGHVEVEEILAADPPDHILVLGTRMGESTSFWSPQLCPAKAFIHVDVDPQAFGTAYPNVPTHAVQSDVGEFLRRLLLEIAPVASRPALPALAAPALPAPAQCPVRPQVLFGALQRVVIDGSDAPLIAESGNSFCWSTNLLRFATPGRYRVSTGFGSMGHAATGVVGMALAREGKAVAVLGDGAMLMLSEVHSAVQYEAQAVWVVLNDACYLMCEQGMQTLGWQPFGTRLNRVDFVAIARALGADGLAVDHESQLDDALRAALASPRPFVLDVRIDAGQMAPSGRRHRSLLRQGFDDDASC